MLFLRWVYEKKKIADIQFLESSDSDVGTLLNKWKSRQKIVVQLKDEIKVEENSWLRVSR